MAGPAPPRDRAGQEPGHQAAERPQREQPAGVRLVPLLVARRRPSRPPRPRTGRRARPTRPPAAPRSATASAAAARPTGSADAAGGSVERCAQNARVPTTHGEHRDREAGDRVPRGGQHGHEDRAEHEDRLVDDGLDRVRRLDVRRVAQDVGPPGAHAGADLGQRAARPPRRRRRRRGSASRTWTATTSTAMDSPKTALAVDSTSGLAEAVDEPGLEDREGGVGDHVRRGDGAGDAVGAGGRGDQQDDAEAHHGDRQPRHETRRAEPQRAGLGEHPAVGRQHRRERRAAAPRPPNPRPTPYDGPHAARHQPVRRPPAGVLRRTREARGRRPVPRERHPRPRDPARAAGGGGGALLPVRRTLPDQRPEPGVPGRPARGPGRRGHRPAGLLGQPQLGPLPDRHGGADGRRRHHPGGLLRDQRLLVVLQLPAVPREPLRRRRGRRERPAPGQAAPLLQPPGLRGAGGRRHAGRAGRAARRGARRRPPRVRHPLDPAVDERGQRPRGRGVRRAAPQRRRRRSSSGSGRRPAAGTRTSSSTARGPGRRTSPGSSRTSTTTSSGSATGAPARS